MQPDLLSPAENTNAVIRDKIKYYDAWKNKNKSRNSLDKCKPSIYYVPVTAPLCLAPIDYNIWQYKMGTNFVMKTVPFCNAANHYLLWIWFGLILHLPFYGLHWKPQLSDDKLSAFAGHWVDFLIQYGYLIRLSIRLSFNLNLCLFEFGARSGGEHMKRHQDNKEWAYRLTYRYRLILQLQAYQSHANPIKANDSARSVINWIAYCDYFHQVLSYVLDHCLCYSHVFAFISDNLNLMCLC